MSLENFNLIVPWTKFRKVGSPPTGSAMDAETISLYNAKDIKPGRKDNAVVFVSAKVIIDVNIHRSWVVKGRMNSSLLKHEQGHFDITALAARTFYDEVLKLSAPDFNTLKKKMKKLNSDLQAKINQANIRYDMQTDHSRNKAGQDKWNKAIAAEKQSPYGNLDNLPS